MLRIKRGIRRFGPRASAARINEYMREAWEKRGGATVRVDGHYKPLRWTESLVLQPGIVLEAVGEPMMYGRARTSIEPQHGDPVFVLDDGRTYGAKVQPWGSQQLRGFQIWATRPDVWALDARGGNTLTVDGLTSGYGKYPLARGITCEPGPHTRWNDAQYAKYRNIRFTRSRELVTLTRNVPDTVFEDCLLYGTEGRDSTGVIGAAGVNNIKWYRVHVQFTGKGWNIDGHEWLVHGGQWENRSGKSPYAPYAIRLGPNARDIKFDSYSMANFSSLEGPVFDLHPQADRYRFRDLTGHVSPAHVPEGFEDRFSWL